MFNLYTVFHVIFKTTKICTSGASKREKINPAPLKNKRALKSN